MNENETPGPVETKPGYIMVQMKVKSLDDLNARYAPFVFPILHRHGGEMIAGSPEPQVKEGDWNGNWAAVLRFPSVQAAQNWYHDAEYQPYRDLRVNEIQSETGRVVILEGF